MNENSMLSRPKDNWANGNLYERYVGRWSRPVAREFLEWLAVPAGQKWLDVGCGTGALSQTILEFSDPAHIKAIDRSEAFVAFTRAQTQNQRIQFEVGDAQALNVELGIFDAIVSGLVLNFIPQPEQALAGMRRVARKGGVVGAYVWDYAEGMQLMRHFWDAAVALDPKVSDIDEVRRFPHSRPEPLKELFQGAGFNHVEVRPIEVPTVFRDFDDYWSPFLGGQGPAPSYLMSLSDERRAALRERVRAGLPISADGSIPLVARAWAVRGYTEFMTTDLCFLPAIELARLLRNKDISAREVVSAHLQQVERVNSKVNAIVTLVAEQALTEADRVDAVRMRGDVLGPLHGLPIAHKDLQNTRGIRTTYGSPIYSDFVPTADSLVVERLKGAGAITIGKTNVPEFGAGSQTFNNVFGATRNPYDLTKTSGGSSGGAATALACGFMPIADGSDMGGSLRNPANFCNVVGLRPSPGRVPSWPVDLGWFTLSVDGPMARTVGDVALTLSALAGPDARSPISLADSGSRFTQPLERDFKGTRVAWIHLGLPYEPEVTQAVHSTRGTFESLGCIIEEVEPDFSDADEIFKTWRAWSFEAGLSEEYKTQKDKLKDTVIWNIEQGLSLTGPQLARVEIKRTQLFHRIREFMEKYEFLILPVSQVLPFDVETPYPNEINGEKMSTYIDWMKSCYYISTIGHPALSVPGTFTASVLPVGVQIVGRHLDDWGVLQLGHAFEQATQLWKRHPEVAL